MTAALEGGEWSAARPGRTLPPGKTRYPFYRRLGGPQGRSGRADQQSFTTPKYRVPRRSGKILFIMKQTLWKNNLDFVEDVAMVPPPMPPHVLMNFRGFPPVCGDSVADF